MSSWVIFFQFFQVFYLIISMIAFLTMTTLMFTNKVSLNADELYQEFVLDNKEYYEEAQIPIPSKDQVVLANWLFKGIIVALVPASLLIYRARLCTLHAFVMIKKHQGNKKGVAYNRCV